MDASQECVEFYDYSNWVEFDDSLFFPLPLPSEDAQRSEAKAEGEEEMTEETALQQQQKQQGTAPVLFGTIAYRVRDNTLPMNKDSVRYLLSVFRTGGSTEWRGQSYAMHNPGLSGPFGGRSVLRNSIRCDWETVELLLLAYVRGSVHERAEPSPRDTDPVVHRSSGFPGWLNDGRMFKYRWVAADGAGLYGTLGGPLWLGTTDGDGVWSVVMLGEELLTGGIVLPSVCHLRHLQHLQVLYFNSSPTDPEDVKLDSCFHYCDIEGQGPRDLPWCIACGGTRDTCAARGCGPPG